MSNALKKTMVFLGLAEDDLENEQSERAAAEQPTQAHTPARAQHTEKTAQVTPLRKLQTSRQPVAHNLNEILTLHPKQYSDSRTIAESFREDVPVIINLSHLTDSDAKRTIDFASGLVMGLQGRIERVTGKVFLLAPTHIAATSEADLEQVNDDENDSGSFFVSAAQ